MIDGTKIKVSKPLDPKKQKKIFSMKKKQFSLNFQIIVLLNGEIIFLSKHQEGSSDQSHWNKLGLREKFIKKKYGIIGDAGYTFNRKEDNEKIIGFIPYKKPKKSKKNPNIKLTEEQKKFNRELSQKR